MPRTPEHLVETHRIARERVAAGKPAWAYTVDLSSVFHNEDMGQAERTAAIVRILRASRWVKETDDPFGRRAEVIDGLADAGDDIEEFNGWFDELYDLADYDRAWIKTH